MEQIPIEMYLRKWALKIIGRMRMQEGITRWLLRKMGAFGHGALIY